MDSLASWIMLLAFIALALNILAQWINSRARRVDIDLSELEHLAHSQHAEPIARICPSCKHDWILNREQGQCECACHE